MSLIPASSADTAPANCFDGPNLVGTGRAATFGAGLEGATTLALLAGFLEWAAGFIFLKDCVFALTERDWGLLLLAFEGFDFFGI
jgi:hypothetical protein